MNRKFLLMFLFCACVPALWAQATDGEMLIVDSAAFARVDSLAWVAARDSNTVEVYQSYLAEYSRYQSEAEEALNYLLDEQAWNQALKLNSSTAYESYLRQFARHREEAQTRLTALIEEQAWGATLALGTREAYLAYADKYQKYRAEALEWVRSQDDEALWRQTVKENSISAVAAYFEKGGVNHVVEASEMSARIERQIDLVEEAEALLQQKQNEQAYNKAVEVEAQGDVPEYLQMRVLACKEPWAYVEAAGTKSQDVIRAYLKTYAPVASERHMTAIQKRKK